MTTHDELRDFLQSQKHFVLAVVLEDGSPWAVPLSVVKWRGRSLEWKSALDTVHSRAIAHNPRVSLCIFMKDGAKQVGFYATGAARITDDHGDGFGAYTISIEHAWLNDEDFVKRELDMTFIDEIGGE